MQVNDTFYVFNTLLNNIFLLFCGICIIFTCFLLFVFLSCTSNFMNVLLLKMQLSSLFVPWRLYGNRAALDCSRYINQALQYSSWALRHGALLVCLPPTDSTDICHLVLKIKFVFALFHPYFHKKQALLHCLPHNNPDK